jgi:hypothetical protein
LKLKPPTLLRKHRLRGLILVGAVFAGVSGVALSQTTPALADPTEQYVLVGSDTIQDVWNGLGLHFTGNLIGSYNATDPGSNATPNTQGEVITPADGNSGASCAFNRPNGSGAGIAALKYSLGDHSSAVIAKLTPPLNSADPVDLPGAGCVDIARSSSGPASGVNGYSGTDAIQYIPFAEDAVAVSTGPAAADNSAGATITIGSVSANPVATNITDADLFTEAQLKTLYDNCGEVTLSDGQSYFPLNGIGTPTGSPKTIDLYVPQSGSGTRSFWGTTLGFPTGAGALPQCVFDTIKAGPFTGVSTEEHDGTAVATDPNGIAPFSVAQYIAQNTGVSPDRHHDAVLHALDGTFPFGSGTPGSNDFHQGLNTSFEINRLVYDVVYQQRIATTGGTEFNPTLFDPTLNHLLVGSSSQVCAAKTTITKFGFATIGTQCGEVLSNLTDQI